MNAADLRDHLRTTLDPVGAPPPSVRSLRAEAGRRKRRNRYAAGALALVVLVGGGVGIAATRGTGGGTSRVTPASAVAGDVVVACRSGDVELPVGRTLHVEPCPDDGDHTVGPTVEPGAVVSQVGTQRFRADRPGTAALTIEYTGCRAPLCARDQHLIATITVHVVAASATVAVPCRTGAVTLAVGQQLRVDGCQPQAAFTDGDEGVLEPGAVPETYPTPLPVLTARKPGTVTLGLSRRPVCSPGEACSQLVQALGTITVTVVAA